MKHLPNILTMMRLFLIPVFIYLFFSGTEEAHVYALLIYLLAGLTDVLDGYLARKYQVISVTGIVLDPLADKLMLLTALICLAMDGIVPPWILAVILAAEGTLILAGLFMYFRKNKDNIPSNKFGKAATVAFAVAVCLMVLLPSHPVSFGVLLLALLMKLTSVVSYSKRFIVRHLPKTKKALKL